MKRKICALFFSLLMLAILLMERSAEAQTIPGSYSELGPLTYQAIQKAAKSCIEQGIKSAHYRGAFNQRHLAYYLKNLEDNAREVTVTGRYGKSTPLSINWWETGISLTTISYGSLTCSGNMHVSVYGEILGISTCNCMYVF